MTQPEHPGSPETPDLVTAVPEPLQSPISTQADPDPRGAAMIDSVPGVDDQPGAPIEAPDTEMIWEVPTFARSEPGSDQMEHTHDMISGVPGVLEDDDRETEQEEPFDQPDLIDVPRFCPGCGSQVAGHEQFCEACGLPLLPSSSARSPEAIGELSTVATRKQSSGTDSSPRCADCGGSIDADGYCETCGTKALSGRDHFEENPAPWLGGVCDKGLRHERNEDALAIAVGDSGDGVIVVCDGVSTSDDSHVASMACAQAAREFLVSEVSRTTIPDPAVHETMAAGLVDATVAANAAVVCTSDPESDNSASCTIVAVVVTQTHLHYAHLGDSRLYWFGDDGQLLLLTADDSVAQTRIEMGVPREEAETGVNAHAITRWLGRDSEDIIPHTGAHAMDGAGWALVCTDGLWNYASDPAQLWSQLIAAIGPDRENADPLRVARSLVTWANQQGGRDNITVALARVSPRVEPAPIQE